MGEDLKKTKELVDMIKNELEHLETVYDMDVRGQRLAYADVLTMVQDLYENDLKALDLDFDVDEKYL
ncbi:MAG: hypothetical protein MJ063_00810 [Lachnospiraceae bacterium]|mgnify:FL=1|nr:hypothetical protein [Lachnospiraceae bacterium]